ncbi:MULTISPECIES: hypothetical protein [Spiroplasma]|uniref:Uncharacterized protein n=1 Tax=Spiroplasma eriocheiris TaxID=315358 RepID=A0A0H3XK77_9MOLU|nr:hypothetical protein [Spiroplasma eriocheiris]AHF57834.1 hypothetical protein SPE_0710 [Spiroplasma eriocheiris CCTCC M 207170]AKM54281.1 hypothetical protein SERIO_v1c07170 [Spiroplasma eriocheiris]
MDSATVQDICYQIEKFEFEDLFAILSKIEEIVNERTKVID